MSLIIININSLHIYIFLFISWSVVHGHHVFKQIWSPVVGEVLAVDREPRNAEDRYAVAVVVQVIILVESHYFQLEFKHITLLFVLVAYSMSKAIPRGSSSCTKKCTCNTRKYSMVN